MEKPFFDEVEDSKVDLTRDKKKTGTALAAKFFTRRNVNVEAVARTFLPIWRTRGNFEVSDGKDNVVLVSFEMDVDAEKVIQGQLWAFDRHLVALQRYDGSVPIQNLVFQTSIFWVQIHNLPFSLLTVEATLSIGETIGKVYQPKDTSEMRGGSFMRVRVEVDITKPLCRGRKISWDQSSEGWAAFMYERLPNFCYWCGLVSHGDKDCVLWLNSRGTLQVEDQQFGPWLRAPQFNQARKTVVEVQGYEQPRREMAQPKASDVVQTGEIRKDSSRRPVEAVTDTGTLATKENGEGVVPGEDGETYGTISRILRRH